MAHADDEFLSALLDGEPAVGDAAHVDTCDVCQARLAMLRRAASAVASPVISPSPHQREAAFAAALRAADEPLRVAALSSVGQPIPMRSAQRKASAGPRRMNTLSAAAALVVALAVGGWAISQIGTNSHPSTSSDSALQFGATQDQAKAATPTAGLGSADAAPSLRGALTSTTVAGQVVSGGATASGGGKAGPYDAGDIGEINDVALVSQRAHADLNQSPEVQAENAMQEASPCPYDAPNVAVWQATLTYNGEAAVAHLVKIDETKDLMQILRRADCSVLASQEFAPTTPH